MGRPKTLKKIEFPTSKLWIKRCYELHSKAYEIFIWASANGYINNMLFFIRDCCMDVNCCDGAALNAAVRRDQLDAVKLLIAFGADVKLVDNLNLKYIEQCYYTDMYKLITNQQQLGG